MDDPEFNPYPVYSKVETSSHLKDAWSIFITFEGQLTSRQINGIKDYIHRLTRTYQRADVDYKNIIKRDIQDRYPYIIYNIEIRDEDEYFPKQTEDKY